MLLNSNERDYANERLATTRVMTVMDRKLIFSCFVFFFSFDMQMRQERVRSAAWCCAVRRAPASTGPSRSWPSLTSSDSNKCSTFRTRRIFCSASIIRSSSTCKSLIFAFNSFKSPRWDLKAVRRPK